MIKFTTGDMFAVPADIRVNTVNCVGVMGAGVALAFKTRYPEMFKEYKKECDRDMVKPGKLHVWKNLMGDWVINFPTKRHWREKSRYEDIEAGLLALREYLENVPGKRIALPALGCGHGGLDWERVSGMIKQHLEGVNAEVIVFSPSDSRAVGDAVRDRVAGQVDEVNAWGDVPLNEIRDDVEDRSVAVAGSDSLFGCAVVFIAMSHKPHEQEQQAALACVRALARPGVTISVCGGTRLARLSTEAALEGGADVVLWIAEGLRHYKPSSDLLSHVRKGQVAVASVASMGQRWNQNLAWETLWAACHHSKTILVTDPHPAWISKSPLKADAASTRCLFFTNYEAFEPHLKRQLLDLHAQPISRRAESGEPKIQPVLEALGSVGGDKTSLIREDQVSTTVAPVNLSVATPSPVSMPNSYPKRLIEVDLPIRRISDHARREKSIRHGHISTLHIWWARRPLAACRAVLCAALWPDPVDELCPRAFQLIAAERMWHWSRDKRARISTGSAATFDLVRQHTSAFALTQHRTTLRQALLNFIADFANWDSSTVPAFLETARVLTAAAHYGLSADAANAGFVESMDERAWTKAVTDLRSKIAEHPRPLVVDPFAGGGSIPLEALRIGADAFASDLNPVAVLLNKVVLEYLPRHGRRLADAVREWGAWVKAEAEKELVRFYPPGDDGSTPIAYLWARTIRCEGPGCGSVVPLLRSLWLAKKAGRSIAIQLLPNPKRQRCDFRIIVKTADGWVAQDDRKIKIASPTFDGTVRRGSATCPCCGYTTPVVRVREQLKERRGGADDALLYCVVTLRASEQGRLYRLPTERDLKAVKAASEELEKRRAAHQGPLSLVPDEEISLNELRRISLPLYGMKTWGDVFSARQNLSLTTLGRIISNLDRATGLGLSGIAPDAVQTLMAIAANRLADSLSSSVTWTPDGEFQGHTFTRQALAFVSDFAEVNPWCDAAGNFAGAVAWVARVCEAESGQSTIGQIERASAANHPLPDDSANAIVTDPPYYDAVPYSHLSDFFYVWFRRSLARVHPSLFSTSLVQKSEEIVVDRPHERSNSTHDIVFYERELTKAFGEGRRVVRPDGIGTIVFASKTTASWEAILKAVIEAGWIITGSWPIDTEREARMAAQGQARLASSVHLVVRPRETADGKLCANEVGDWRDVIAELPRRIHEWMPRLAEEGVVGADAIFACLGPALEIFSRYARVEKVSGDLVPLREFLEQVWAAVALEALSLVFAGASAEGFEPDARLTAMWLWTLTAPQSSADAETGEDDGDGADDDESTGSSKKARKGFVLEFDAARKIAQGLGAHLEVLTHLVDVKGDQARLLPVAERTRHLFGKDQESSPLTTGKKKPRDGQTNFLAELLGTDPGTPAAEAAWAEHTVTRVGDTTLDRVHQAMILFAAGRGEALRRFLVEDAAGRDAKFWRLAQALSALYPKACEEKRWVDGVLARKKGLGL